jgi:hypothetical protein
MQLLRLFVKYILHCPQKQISSLKNKIMKEVKFALTMGLVTTIVFLICFFSECFDEKAKTPSAKASTPNFSKAQDYIDSLEKREEVVLFDTVITHFGHRPGYLELDTTYIVSYTTKDPKKAELVFKNAKKK